MNDKYSKFKAIISEGTLIHEKILAKIFPYKNSSPSQQVLSVDGHYHSVLHPSVPSQENSFS